MRPLCLTLSLLYISAFARAEWSNPWISDPPPDSEAASYVSVTFDEISANLLVKESCPTDKAIATLNFVGTNSPILAPQPCTTKLAIVNTAIVLISPLDYESNPIIVCNLNIRGDPNSFRSLVISVEDVNDNIPYFDPSTPNVLSYPENKQGDVYTFKAIDRDENGKGILNFGLTVVQGDPKKFRLTERVGPDSMKLQVVEELDREMESFYLLEITVSDKDGYNATRQVALNVEDKPDSPPVWVKTQPFIRITEELTQNTVIFKVEARDGDTFNSPIIYSIKDPRESFTIDSRTGEVMVANTIDSDVTDFNPYFDIEITATVDRIENPLSTPSTTTIYVEDANDNVPSFNLGHYEISAPEDFIGRLTDYDIQVYDPDLGNGGAYQVKVKGSENVASFVKITPSDGKGRNNSTFNLVISQLGLLDFENENGARDIAFELEVVEAFESGHTATCSVTIHATDVNDNAPQMTVEPGDVVEIYENSSKTPNGLVIAIFRATDKDSGNFGTVKFRMARYNLEGTDEFAIDGDTGELTVKNNVLLDYEGPTKSFKFFVEAYDNNPTDTTNPVNVTPQLITVNLKDVNDNAPMLPPSQLLTNISEIARKDDLVYSIQAEDKDAPNTDNSRLTYTLVSQRRIEGQEACPHENIFRIDNESNKGSVKVNVFNLTDCYGTYEIVVRARDVGDAINGALNSEDVSYQIRVVDVNNNAPEFIFPEKEGSTVYVYETSITGKPLTDTNGNVVKLKATDLDEENNGIVHFLCEDANFASTFEITELLESNTAVITVKRALNRTEISSYNFRIIAKDEGIPVPRESSAMLRINVRFEKKQPPYFKEKIETIAFFENAEDTKLFQMATDPDNITLYPGEEPYDLCYYIACGNAHDFKVGGEDKKKNELYTKGTLDREDPPDMLYVVVEASNSCERNPTVPGLIPCTAIDLTKPFYLNVSIDIKDVKDCPPIFEDSLYGGTTFGDKKGDEVLRVITSDPDENDSATCGIKDNNITTSDPSLPRENQFTIDRTNRVLLGFDVQETMKGYFSFEVTCTDGNSNRNTAKAQIFIVDKNHKVNVVFGDPAVEVEAKRSTIERIFTDTYGYECNVEKVTENPPDASGVITTTTVTHFIDTKNEEPVLASEIEKLKTNSTLNKKLQVDFDIAELNLIQIGSVKEVIDVTSQIFMILFIVACIVLVALIIYGFFLITRTLELKRKVKALSQTKFGSAESVNNRVGVTLPNTNVFAEGSNPIFDAKINGKSSFTPRSSDSSGDSVLIGVEDNPEFASYKPKSTLSKNRGTQDLTDAIDDRRQSFQVTRNPLAGLVIEEDDERANSFGSITDDEDESTAPHPYARNVDGLPPPNYPPPPLPPSASKEKKRPAPPPPADYDNDAYESGTEL